MHQRVNSIFILALFFEIVVMPQAYAESQLTRAENVVGNKQLDRLAADYFFDSMEAVTGAGYKLLQSLPDSKTKSSAVLPFLLINLSPELQLLYRTSSAKGVMVAGKFKEYPLVFQDIQRGDEIVEVEGVSVESEQQINRILNKRENATAPLTVKFRRGTAEGTVEGEPIFLKVKIPFILNGEKDGLYASSDPSGCLYLTRTLLDFVENQNELAFVLSREINRALKRKAGRFDILKTRENVRMDMVWNYYFLLPPKTNTLIQLSPVGTLRMPVFSTAEDEELDRIAIDHLQAAGFDVKEAIGFFERYAAEKTYRRLDTSNSIVIPSPERLTVMRKMVFGTGAGGGVSIEEKKKTQIEISKQQADLFFDRTLKVISIGYKLLLVKGESSAAASVKALPLIYVDFNNNRKFYSSGEGVFAVGILGGFDFETKSSRGDQILSVDGQKVFSEVEINKLINEKKGDSVILRFKNATNEWDESFKLIRLMRKVTFAVTYSDDINAFADMYGGITVTSGMLRFVENDDQLAFVLGHEIAHLMHHHVSKGAANVIVGKAVGITLGGLVENYAPGFGNLTSQVTSGIVTSPYSKKLEIEADKYAAHYVRQAGYSLKKGYSIWEKFSSAIPASQKDSITATHPASPERYLRLRKEAGDGGGEIPNLPAQETLLATPLDSQADPKKIGILRAGLAEDPAFFSILTGIAKSKSIFDSKIKQIVWFAQFDAKGSTSNFFSRKYKVQWTSPDGKVYKEEEFKASMIDESVARTELKFKEQMEGPLLGRWQVKVWKKDTLIDDRYFEIVKA